MVDLVNLKGIYVTEHPNGAMSVRLWCGNCAKPLHWDDRHWGNTPFLTLLVKMADAHRETECPHPKGPFLDEWHPRIDERASWER
jgi:hypothetical protein